MDSSDIQLTRSTFHLSLPVPPPPPPPPPKYLGEYTPATFRYFKTKLSIDPFRKNSNKRDLFVAGTAHGFSKEKFLIEVGLESLLYGC